MYQTLQISHAEAQKMIAGIQAEVERDRKAAAVAVTDSHGELVAFLRMDGCQLLPVSIAINKAFTAARTWQESGEIGKASRQGGFPMTNHGDLRYTGWAGGFPIVHDGRVIGAIGVSGLDEERESSLARMAIDLIR